MNRRHFNLSVLGCFGALFHTNKEWPDPSVDVKLDNNKHVWMSTDPFITVHLKDNEVKNNAVFIRTDAYTNTLPLYKSYNIERDKKQVIKYSDPITINLIFIYFIYKDLVGICSVPGSKWLCTKTQRYYVHRFATRN